MSTLAHLKCLFVLGGLTEKASIGLDFESIFAWDNDKFDDLMGAAQNGWSTMMTQRFPASSKMVATQIYAYDIVGGKRQITLGPKEALTSLPGTRGGSALPPQNAVVATHRTAISSRRRRGRVYLPPIASADVQADGTINDPFVTNLQTSYNDWVLGMQNAAVPSNQFKHVVVSLTYDLVTVVTTRTVNGRIDTQRRRLPR